jgi:hypothetical protein
MYLDKNEIIPCDKMLDFCKMLEYAFREEYFYIEANTAIDAEDGKMIEISICNALGSPVTSTYLFIDDLKEFVKKEFE